MSDAALTAGVNDPLLDDRVRGFPSGHAPLRLSEIGKQGWRPYDGHMSLPLMSLDEAAFAGNASEMLAFTAAAGADIAPHAKTPMSVALAHRLVDAGAWGASVADIRQAAVLLKAGLNRLILANQVGGLHAARRLANVLAGYPDAELHVFVDTIASVEALAEAWSERSDLPPLGLMVELGLARGGARSETAAAAIVDAVLARETANFRLTGVSAYEGSAAVADPAETQSRIALLIQLMSASLRSARAKIGAERPLLLSAGGSVYFDMIVSGLKPTLAADVQTRLMLRSGAIFFHDHGVYERGLKALDARRGFRVGREVRAASERFRPALRVWAEVTSRPETGLAVCGLGMRDVATDQDLPRPLVLYRDGARIADLEGVSVSKLNDQHAFVSITIDADIRVGDVIEFGLSHPCTCLDRHAILYALDPGQTVVGAYLTSFG